jgi:hypothetical protein
MLRRAVAIDFDGTICRSDKFPQIVAPIPEAIAFIRECRAAGVAVILWTCRTDRHLADALAWCDSQQISFDAVNDNLPDWIAAFRAAHADVSPNGRKVAADLYLDDRSVGGIDWKQAFAWLRS